VSDSTKKKKKAASSAFFRSNIIQQDKLGQRVILLTRSITIQIVITELGYQGKWQKKRKVTGGIVYFGGANLGEGGYAEQKRTLWEKAS